MDPRKSQETTVIDQSPDKPEMSSAWQEFLEAHDAVIENGKVTSFGPSAQPYPSIQDTCVCELTPLGLIRVTGEEARTFLHSQFTNDLEQVTAHTGQLNSYCSPKGRVLSIFLIFKHDADYFLVLPQDVIEITLRRLVMYKLRTQVDLIDASGQSVLFGVAGPGVEPAFENLGITLPQKVYGCTQENGATLVRLPSENVRILIMADAETAVSLCSQLSEKLPLATFRLWDLHDISCGIPQVTALTSEAFTPQMTNLELIDGVSFSKGCYPGQEVVARTHYLGKPNRRMYRANIATERLPEPGTNVFSAEEGDQPLGKVVVSQMVSARHASALIVLRTQKEEDPCLRIGSADGPAISLQELPYSLQSGPD